jgi:Tfp pilus assembly protein PilF
MKHTCHIAALLAAAASLQCSRPPTASSGANRYIDSKVCAACHSRIFEAYRHTGMARSFYAPPGDSATSPLFYHKPSDTWFRITRHSDGIYQRRWQIGYQGGEENIEEVKVDYVMGSGNHVRTYLHRTVRGTLIELPLAWYAERGGQWALNPGYDSERWPSHRKIGYDCMFCHNAYPSIPVGHEDSGSEPVFTGALPQGIDCQRCHGPGEKHVTAAQVPGARTEDVRVTIVNPARLAPDRRLEVCMQCHLETTSFPLPNAIRRFDRAPFSYQPGEPLTAFELFFDHAPGTGHEGKFEIVSSAYRLRQSRCFRNSAEALTCTTCHNPHDIPHGPEAMAQYNRACRKCHAAAFDSQVAGGKHTAATNCVGCHMPKRRTADVVHAVMTDHRILRAPEVRDPLAALPELHGKDIGYQGEVVAYYGDDALYTSVAQLVARSNVEAGAPRLEAELSRNPPRRPEPWIELGDAWRDRKMPEKAAAAYREALQRKPDSVLILRRLAGVTRDRSLLQQAVAIDPSDAAAWYDLGLLESGQGRKPEALAAFAKAAALDPDMADAQNSLGAVQAESGSAAEAEASFRAALRLDPFHADAHANLADLLARREDLSQAAWHYERAVRLAPGKAPYEFNYGFTLARLAKFGEAERHMEAALRADPNLAEAHDLLGGLHEQRGQTAAALREYQEAVRIRPDFGKAHVDLGTLLAGRRDLAGAAEHFRKALGDPNAAVRRQAQESLRAIGAQ